MKKSKRRRIPELKPLGDAIRQRREALGISQEELGYLAGLHRTYIGSVERAERNMTILSLSKVAGALQIEPHELLKRGQL